MWLKCSYFWDNMPGMPQDRACFKPGWQQKQELPEELILVKVKLSFGMVLEILEKSYLNIHIFLQMLLIVF